MKALLLRSDGITISHAPAVPLFIAPRMPSLYEAVVFISKIVDDGVTTGSLGIIWSKEKVMRRASGGGRYIAQSGDYYLTIIFRGGSLREIHVKYEDRFYELGDNTVVGIGKSATHPFIEVYSRRDPLAVIKGIFDDMTESDEGIDTELLEPIAEDLMKRNWIDPVDSKGELVSYRVTNDRHYFGIVGIIEDGLIIKAWPDATIHTYPPGLARSVIKEIGMVPPSQPLAFHAANSFVGLVEYAGVDSSHIVEAFRGFIVEAERVAGRYTG